MAAVSTMGGGGFKPMSKIKMKMDVAMAMAILGFPPSQAFEHTELIQVEKQFMIKIHQIEMEKYDVPAEEPLIVNSRFETRKKKQSNTVFFKKKVDARKLNEAFQFLVQKRRRLTGRSMTSNWQIIANKTNCASNATNAFRLDGMPTKDDIKEEEEYPMPENQSLLTSILALSSRNKQPMVSNEEDDSDLEDIEERNGKGLSKEEKSQLARELAAEFISTKRIRSLDEVLYESRTTREMNYWLQFSFMSKENRDYFIMRHGKNPDNFLAQLKRAKKENNRMNVTLPDRLQKLQKPNNKKLPKNRSRDPRVPTRNRLNASKGASKSRIIENNGGFDTMGSINEDGRYENLDDPLNLNRNNIFIVNSGDSEGSSANTNSIEDEHSNTIATYNGVDDLESVKDIDSHENRTYTMNSKLKVLRRKLSHLNMNPNLT